MREVAKVAATNGLNLRRTQSAKSDVLDTLPYGTVVDVEGRSGNWILTSYNSKSGYIYQDYVKVSSVGPDLPFAVKVVLALIAAIMTLWVGISGWFSLGG